MMINHSLEELENNDSQNQNTSPNGQCFVSLGLHCTTSLI